MAETVGFWVMAVVLVGGSLGVVLSPNLFHAAVLYLPAALVATGAIFWLLESPFLFGIQLLLYAGGVVTIVVFAIMLTERLVGESIRQSSRYVFNGACVETATISFNPLRQRSSHRECWVPFEEYDQRYRCARYR